MHLPADGPNVEQLLRSLSSKTEEEKTDEDLDVNVGVAKTLQVLLNHHALQLITALTSRRSF
jgi:hypothetical protein